MLLPRLKRTVRQRYAMAHNKEGPNMLYKGLVIKNSLIDSSILNQFNVVKTAVDDDWELFWIETDEKGIDLIAKNLSGNEWYADFANGDNGIVIFKDKIFKMNVHDKATWQPAKEYGISIGIPSEQMDFGFEY